MRSLLTKYRERMQHQHRWEVELHCPACGIVAAPVCRGWTSRHAVGFDHTPTIYADLDCPECGAVLKDVAGRKLVELFADVLIPARNRRLMSAFTALMLCILSVLLIGAFLSFFSGWRIIGAGLIQIPLLFLPLLAPTIMWFNWQIASIRCRCVCGPPAYKFMGLLGRSYCYRCSSCGRLLRLRD